MPRIFINEMSVDSSTSILNLLWPISAISYKMKCGANTYLMMLVHFVRCNLISPLRLSKNVFLHILYKWSTLKVDACSLINNASEHTALWVSR